MIRALKTNIKLTQRKLMMMNANRYSQKDYIMKNYKKHKGKFPDLENPLTFGEKIQYIKLYGNLERYSNYVCKYNVRKYIENQIGKKYLINLLGVYNNVEEINFNELPEKFVLKCTHGSGYNIIVKDKTKLNIKDAKRKLRFWMKENFYNLGKESQYKDLKPLIICEEYMQDDSGELRDYRFFCFNGKCEFIQVDNLRQSNLGMDFYDTQWNPLELEFSAKRANILLPKPLHLEKMICFAEKLAKDIDIPFIRVDFYYTNEHIYFGELTFTPTDGMGDFKPVSEDIRIASMINLEKYK